MASLTHAIQIFQRGGLSSEDFIAQIGRTLAADPTDSRQLLEILQEENTKFPLPPDVYAEVQHMIERRGSPPQEASDETRMLTESLHTSPPSGLGSVLPAVDAEPNRVARVGDTLNGRFELKECLGVGGMGMVFKALDLRKLEASDRNPFIAIKVLNLQFRGHPKSLIALQREAKKAQTLAHPNIVTVYDFDRDGTIVYLTMEYLSGQPLNRLLRAPDFKGMPFEEAIRIVEGMARALAYAHQRGFVHCDFKPANVFLTDSGEVKVIDFGIARVFQQPEQDSEATVFDPGSLGGLTPAYASPEMLEHLEPDPRDDVYALACITYELLTGQHPFERLSAIQARAAGLKPKRPKNLNGRAWRALRAALSFDREERTRSITRFITDMGGGRGGVGSRTLVVGSAVALAALLAVGVTRYLNTPSSPAVPPPIREAPTPLATAVQPPPDTPPPTAKPPPAPVLAMSAVTPVLAAVPCSALSASIDGGSLRVDGYLPASYSSKKLAGQLGAIPGVNQLAAQLDEVDETSCGVMQTLGPYWVSNRRAEHAASIQTQGDRSQLSEGDPLVIQITTPAFKGYAYVDYFVKDGGVVHLVPSVWSRQNQTPAGYAATIGGLGNWVIGKPFGTELIALVVAPEPLFDGLRPEPESREDYLKALKSRLDEIAKAHGPDGIAVDFVQITTKARNP